MSLRRTFLEPFFGTLGVAEICDWHETLTEVYGKVRYLPEAERLEFSDSPEDDIQEFRWAVSETEVPGGAAYAVVCFLDDNKLVDTDRIILPRAQLRGLFEAATPQQVSPVDFDRILDEIAAVRVEMIEDGEVVDYFRISA